jgi:hypothetical protein
MNRSRGLLGHPGFRQDGPRRRDAIRYESTGILRRAHALPCFAPKARQVAERFVAAQEEKRRAVEMRSLQQLLTSDFLGASGTVAKFEAEQVFSRSVGIDWSKPDTKGHVEILKAIFEGRPKIIKGLAESEWEPLRVGAAMMYLWGTNKASRWLPEKFVGLQKFDDDTSARMVLFHA